MSASKPATAKKATAKKAAPPKAAPPKAARTKEALTLAQAMRELEQAGSAQTRKTYARHGAAEPMFGVSFATLKALTKRIGTDHDLAVALWDTGNFDARNLAVKVVDPLRMSPTDLDRWVRSVSPSRMCGGYAAMLAAEGPYGAAKLDEWLAAEDLPARTAGWTLLGQLAMRDESIADAEFERWLTAIERGIDAAPNAEREVMNHAVIAIGCRSAGLRKAALTAAKRIGKVEIDHGDTACKTPDAAMSIDKAWAHAKSKGFASPAAQERTRATPRLRC